MLVEKIFKKKYLAVVDGEFEKAKGTLEDYLYKDERNNISKVVSKDKKNAKLAKLDYEVLAYNEIKNLSLVNKPAENAQISFLGFLFYS